MSKKTILDDGFQEYLTKDAVLTGDPGIPMLMDLPNVQIPRSMFHLGMQAMLAELEPKAVLVHGYLPEEIFGDFKSIVDLHRYPSQYEITHRKKGA